MDHLRLGGLRVLRHAQVGHHPTQLGMDVLPLPHPRVVEVLAPAQAAELARGALALLLTHVAPQVHIRQEVGGVVGEAGMHLIGGGSVVGRAFAGILDGQGRGDDQHLAETPVAFGLQHHAAEARVDRQAGQVPTDGGEALATVARSWFEGAELLQQAHTVGDGARIRGVDEREGRDVAQPDGGHRQDDGRQVGAQDLRVGELGAGGEVILGVEPDADASGHPAAATGPLVGRSLRHGLDGQPLHLESGAVARDAGGPGVDDVADAGHGQRRLGHVGGQHDPPARVRGENTVLLGRRQPRIQREDLGVREVEATQRLGRVTDLPLP